MCVVYVHKCVCVCFQVCAHVCDVHVCVCLCVHACICVCVAHVHVFWPVPGVSYTMLTLNWHKLINGYLEPYVKGGAWIQCW